MTLIILLIAIALQYYIHINHKLPKIAWFEQYVLLMRKLLAKTPVRDNVWGLIILYIPIFLAVGIIDLLLQGWLFGLLDFLFSLVVLLYCMQAVNLKEQLQGYFAALEEQNLIKAGQEAKTFLGYRPPEDVAGMTRAVSHGIFQKAITQVFAYIFWFGLFGPYGVMLYFVVISMRELARKHPGDYTNFNAAAKQVQTVLDWVPVRLAGLSYALVGHFGSGFSYWLKTLTKGFDINNKIAWKVGLAGLNTTIEEHQKADQTENIAAIELVNNAVVVWIVAIAIFILGYWLA